MNAGTPTGQPGNAVRSAARVELSPGWPLVLAIFAVLSLFSLLPERTRFLPGWSGFAIGGPTSSS